MSYPVLRYPSVASTFDKLFAVIIIVSFLIRFCVSDLTISLSWNIFESDPILSIFWNLPVHLNVLLYQASLKHNIYIDFYIYRFYLWRILYELLISTLIEHLSFQEFFTSQINSFFVCLHVSRSSWQSFDHINNSPRSQVILWTDSSCKIWNKLIYQISYLWLCYWRVRTS